MPMFSDFKKVVDDQLPTVFCLGLKTTLKCRFSIQPGAADLTVEVAIAFVETYLNFKS